MSKRDSNVLLLDMLEAAEKIIKYVAGMNYEQFISDDKTCDAVVRNFEIIGEVAGRVEVAFQLANPQIEWRRIKGLRNRLIHGYSGIDFKIIWIIIQEYLKDLIFHLKLLTEHLK